MRRKDEEEEEKMIPGGEDGLTEGVDWDRVWSRSLNGDVVPPALRELGCVCCLSCPLARLVISITILIYSRKGDVHTIITLTDNAPQGLNESFSSFPLATKVGPLLLPVSLPEIINCLEARPLRLFHALCDGETIYADV
jgi:hypothetical protein